METKFFLFKFNFVDKVSRQCSYIKTTLEYIDLLSFLNYFLFKQHDLPISALDLYWFDGDGDQFKVDCNEDFDIFKTKNPTNGVLWASVNGKREQSNNVQLKHTCETCQSCGLTNLYFYNKVGLMRCSLCNFERGHCCLYIVAGVNVPHVMMEQPICNVETENNLKSADNNNDHAIIPNTKKQSKKNMVDDAELSEERKAANLLARLENLFEKDPEDDKIATQHKNAALKNKSTGAESKPRNMVKKPLPSHVESALSFLTTNGFKNDDGSLTQILLATNGQIKDALLLLQSKNKITTNKKDKKIVDLTQQLC